MFANDAKYFFKKLEIKTIVKTYQLTLMFYEFTGIKVERY